MELVEPNNDRLLQGKDCSRQSYCMTAIRGGQTSSRAAKDGILRALIWL